MNLTVIIVTKDRPVELSRCLTSLQQQAVACRCLVVDGSTTAKPITQQFGYEYYQSQPGITRQRNVARQHVPTETDIVIYCDDDTLLPPDTLAKVINVFSDPTIFGATGNMIGEPTFGLVKKIIGTITGTYTIKPYGISFGLFNVINPLPKRKQVDWLPGAFMCYRWAKVKDIEFDEWFAGYGLAEDFDFSYRVAKAGTLVADPAIQVEHHHSSLNRDWEKFGFMRIKNRAYLRRKFWPKRLDYWLGMWWANGWLIAINAVRGIISKMYRNEFIGEIKAIFK